MTRDQGINSGGYRFLHCVQNDREYDMDSSLGWNDNDGKEAMIEIATSLRSSQ
jgi:hypothetical protein